MKLQNVDEWLGISDAKGFSARFKLAPKTLSALKLQNVFKHLAGFLSVGIALWGHCNNTWPGPEQKVAASEII